MARCNYRTQNWTRQTLGTCPQCAVRCEQENTELYKHKSLRKTCMPKSVVKIKDTRSVSNNEVAFLCRIPVMLRQQQCWKFVSVMRNVDITLAGKLWSQNAAFSESFEHISGCITEWNVWALIGLPWPWTVSGQLQWGFVRYRTTALLCDGASCHTVVVVILCCL